MSGGIFDRIGLAAGEGDGFCARNGGGFCAQNGGKFYSWRAW